MFVLHPSKQARQRQFLKNEERRMQEIKSPQIVRKGGGGKKLFFFFLPFFLKGPSLQQVGGIRGGNCRHIVPRVPAAFNVNAVRVTTAKIQVWHFTPIVRKAHKRSVK